MPQLIVLSRGAPPTSTPRKLAGQDVDLTAGLFDMLGGR